MSGADTDKAARAKPWSKAGLGERWDELLDRRLAGEAVKALALEYGVSVSAVHWNAAQRKKRLKDRDDAVPPRKGPEPATVEALGEGRVRVARGDLSFEFDPEEAEATVRSLFGQAQAAGAEGRLGDYGALMRLVELTRRVMEGPTGRRAAKKAGALLEARDEDESRAPGAAVTLHPHQVAPEGEWRTWLLLGGRGAGKTLAGASWLADQAMGLPGGRVALIGPTLHDVREVMVEGVSGVRSLPRWSRATRPRYEPSRRRLVFDNGCVAQVFSAEDPDSLRGPQFSAAWADEFCAWPAVGARGAAEMLAMLRMGLRLPGPASVRLASSVACDLLHPSTASRSPSPLHGEETGAPGAQEARLREPSVSPPRLCVTTTPRPTRALIRLRDEASCVAVGAPTVLNAAHLAEGFVEELRALYGGTRREAQELEGKVVNMAGALFTAEMMMAARRAEAGDARFDRVVVALDPTASVGGDACGIVAAGARTRADGVREAVVLADRSAAGLSPDGWARRAVALAAEVGATAVVAEVNQGGDMVEAVLKAVGCALPVRAVRASKGKRMRAEPVAALYEQGRVRHAGAFDALEEELMALGSETGEGALDRADALVWAVTDLLVDRAGARGPRVTQL